MKHLISFGIFGKEYLYNKESFSCHQIFYLHTYNGNQSVNLILNTSNETFDII